MGRVFRRNVHVIYLWTPVKNSDFTGETIKYICMKILSVGREFIKKLFNNIKGLFCKKAVEVKKPKRKNKRKKTKTVTRGRLTTNAHRKGKK